MLGGCPRWADWDQGAGFDAEVLISVRSDDGKLSTVQVMVMKWPSVATVTIASVRLVGGSGEKRQLCVLGCGRNDNNNKLHDVRAVRAKNWITYRVHLCTGAHFSLLYQGGWLHCIGNKLYLPFLHAPNVAHWFQFSLSSTRLGQSV